MFNGQNEHAEEEYEQANIGQHLTNQNVAQGNRVTFQDQNEQLNNGSNNHSDHQPNDEALDTVHDLQNINALNAVPGTSFENVNPSDNLSPQVNKKKRLSQTYQAGPNIGRNPSFKLRDSNNNLEAI